MAKRAFAARRARGLLKGLFDWFAVDPPPRPIATDRRVLSIELAGRAITYTLIRARRKSVSMVIERDGLVVRAPMKFALRELEVILRERDEWIVEKLNEWQRRTALVAGDFRDGGSVLFKGKRLGLRVVPSLFDAFEVTENELLIASSVPLSFDARQAQIERWMRECATQELLQEVHAMAAQIHVPIKSVKFTDTRTMWGSCTSDGVVRLTFRLIQLPPAIARYVIAHEVAHRRELNHSPQFWEWVRVLDPHFKSHRRTLAAYTPLLEE